MTTKAQISFEVSFDMQDDLRIDYALAAAGIGAALLALVYLLLI